MKIFNEKFDFFFLIKFKRKEIRRKIPGEKRNCFDCGQKKKKKDT